MPARLSDRTRRTLKTLAQLPKQQTLHYLQYRLALTSGWLKLRTRPPKQRDSNIPFTVARLFPLPDQAQLSAILGPPGLGELRQRADEIAAGRVRLFGGPPVELDLEPPGPAIHWADLERSQAHPQQTEDIKLIWEPARFGWACTLARAYHLLQDEKYTHAFWQFTHQFLDANPAYQGWNWTSAQEVALRLISLAFCLAIFERSPQTRAADLQRLLAALAQHAGRIPPSLAYARAQDNNHLLSEAAGLYTAGCLLPEHPQAGRWRKQGWRVFHQGLQRQIDPQGVYIQHSANYTRLMLQLALWVSRLAAGQQQELPPLSQERLAQATRWLLSLLDHASGQTPNLGPNDGAYILPLTVQPFSDYRPVLQASAWAFLNQPLLERGPGDEMALWLADMPAENAPLRAARTITPHTLRQPSSESWAYLRAARFDSRPGHADQLHLDLWWRGINLARDPGTYRYNAAPPWDNALVHSAVHNTVTLNGRDQMTPAGRFLFLDWAQAEICEYSPASRQSSGKITARHDGYHPLGWEHQRTLECRPDGGWLVTDRLTAAATPAAPATARLHWLLPDWPWEIRLESDSIQLYLRAPGGEVLLRISAAPDDRAASRPSPNLRAALFRAGECVYGEQPAQPTWGWYSPTYNVRQPALALACSQEGRPPLIFESRFTLPPPAAR